jgi:hypothetical protein
MAHIPGTGSPSWAGLHNRLYAPSELVSGKFVHRAGHMKLALNPGGGTAGMCFGDSEGPDLLAGTNAVLAVNSYGSVDIPEVLAWINGFLR